MAVICLFLLLPSKLDTILLPVISYIIKDPCFK